MKIRKKIDSLFWFLVMAFPLFEFALATFRTGSFDFSFAEQFPQGFIYDVLTEIFNTYFGLESQLLINILTWSFYVELAHVLYDVLAMIPRFCHKFIGGFIDNE